MFDDQDDQRNNSDTQNTNDDQLKYFIHLGSKV